MGGAAAASSGPRVTVYVMAARRTGRSGLCTRARLLPRLARRAALLPLLLLLRLPLLPLRLLLRWHSLGNRPSSRLLRRLGRWPRLLLQLLPRA